MKREKRPDVSSGIKKGKQLSVEDNSRHFVDYQDCESVGKDQLVCSRIAERPNLAADNSKLG